MCVGRLSLVDVDGTEWGLTVSVSPDLLPVSFILYGQVGYVEQALLEMAKVQPQ
jgi:hypothetical protein